MQDMVNQTRAFGSNAEEKKATLLAVGAELYERKAIDPLKWRSQLSKEVARICALQSDTQVYRYMNSLGPDGLKELRVACIGNEAEVRIYGPKEKAIDTEEQERIRREKAEWGPKFKAAIAMIKTEKSPMTKTAVARLARGTTIFSRAYYFLRMFSQSELEALGYPKLGEYQAGVPDRKDDPKPTGNDEADDGMIARHVEKYEKALTSLAPTARSRRNLAALLNKPQYAVDGFVYANPSFAEKLVDGKDVFDPKFFSRR